MLERGDKAQMANLTDYGKRIKHRLIDMDRTQKWLQDEISERTGLYMDRSYMTKILTGQLSTPKVVSAINEILGIGESK